MTIELFWRDVGTGPAVLLLHAASGDEESFAPLATTLARRQRVLYPDLPGYGRSPARPHADDFGATYEAIERGLVARGVEQCAVIGWSLGAHHALALALRPSRVRFGCVVALGGFAAVTSDHARQLIAFAEMLEAGVDLTSAEILPAFVDLWVGARYSAASPDVEEVVARVLRSGPGPTIAADVRTVIHRDLRGDLPKLRARLVLRVGADDRATPPRYSQEIAALVPHAELQIVPDCGHMLLIEDSTTMDAIQAVVP